MTRLHGLEAPGHRSDIRTLALSSDDALLLSGSNNQVKIWNPRSGACLRSIEAGYGLCALFAPGNRHAVVGTKEGSLDVIDVAASSRLQSVEAHSGALWSLAALPDRRWDPLLYLAPVYTSSLHRLLWNALAAGLTTGVAGRERAASCCCMPN